MLLDLERITKLMVEYNKLAMDFHKLPDDADPSIADELVRKLSTKQQELLSYLPQLVEAVGTLLEALDSLTMRTEKIC